MSPQAGSDPVGPGPARVLVLGGGGREHALVWSLAREAGVESVIVAPGSDAIGEEPKVRCVPGVAATDPAAVLALATAEDVDLVVVGPEAPLAAGVVDVLEEAGLPTFGPIRAAARIEWSKAFCRDVAAAAGVRMARGEAFWAFGPALAFAREMAAALLQLALLEPTRADDDVRPDECGLASVYSTLSEETASGQDTSVNDRTAAHRSLPFGTLVRVYNQENGSSVVVRITDRGPFVSGRIIDVSQIAAHELGFADLTQVCLKILSLPEKRPAASDHDTKLGENCARA